MPIFIFAENCTDGTNEWLAAAAGDLGIEYQKKPVTRSTKPQGPTKAALVREIRETLNMANRTGDFTKQEIASILDAIRANG